MAGSLGPRPSIFAMWNAISWGHEGAVQLAKVPSKLQCTLVRPARLQSAPGAFLASVSRISHPALCTLQCNLADPQGCSATCSGPHQVAAGRSSPAMGRPNPQDRPLGLGHLGRGGRGGAGASHPRPQGLRATWAQQSGQTHDAQRTATTPSDPTPNRNDPRCTKTPLLQKNDLSEIAPILDVPTLPSWFWFTGLEHANKP